MMKIKNLKGECQQCGQVIEFHAESAGLTAECPHCGKPTELLLAIPVETKSPAQTKAIIYSIVALVILGGGLFVTLAALKRAERLSARQPATHATSSVPLANPFAADGFSVSPVALATNQSGAIVHAVGKVWNLASRQRFGVRIKLELLDDTGSKVGEATDYQSSLEPNAEWQFRALVVDKRAVAAKVMAIKEAQ